MNTDLPRARLGRALKQGVRDAYDRLGLVVASSFIWALAVLIPLTIGLEFQRRVPVRVPWFAACGLLASILVGAPALAGVFRMAYKIVCRDEPGLSDLSSGFRELLWPSWALAGLNLLVTAVLAVDAGFFLGVFGPLKGNRTFFWLGPVCLYLLLGWWMAALHQFPSLVAQRPLGQREGAWAAVKKSLLLTLSGPGFTIGLFAVILGFSALCALTVVGALLLFAGTVSILLTHALRELYIRYQVVEEP